MESKSKFLATAIALSTSTKGICLFDDYMYHEVNLITAQACDFVLTTCPISAFKFKERGINSFFTMLEGDGNLFKKLNLKKKYDVFIFLQYGKEIVLFHWWP